MPLEGTYEPATWDVAADQVERYERTGGADGGEVQGVACVVLWTRGQRSGKVRKSPLIRVEKDGRYAAIASMGGSPTHPGWFRNLQADPRVSLQDGPEVRDYVAREASGEERAQWWDRAVSVWPDYANYQARTERIIPVVLLDPA